MTIGNGLIWRSVRDVDAELYQFVVKRDDLNVITLHQKTCCDNDNVITKTVCTLRKILHDTMKWFD